MSTLATEILQLLSAHASATVDYVAVFMLLNTVAGGHYQERYPEAAIRASLRLLLAEGAIEAWESDQRLAPDSVLPGETPCHFCLRPNR